MAGVSEDLDIVRSNSKADAEHQDLKVVGPHGLTAEDMAFLDGFSSERRKKVLRKVDRRLLPLLGLFYLFSFLDRANIGNAKIEGLDTDLNLSTVQYNTCLAIFFIPYVLLEVPSNIILSRVKRPSIYLGAIVTGWGIVMTLAGVTTNFASLFVVRFFLGVLEAGFFPGAIYTVSRWYLPSETQTRIAVFYTASALSGAFSGLLAAGITQMSGTAGLAGWRWIFIIEGIMTVAGGVLALWLMPDLPELSGKWLDADEIRYLRLRLIADPSRQNAAAQTEKKHNRKVFWSVVTDWQLYLQALSFWGNSVANNGFKFSMPSIIKGMGFASTNAQLLSAPPYIAGAIVSWVSAMYADRIRWRMPFVVGPLALVIIANAVLFAKSEHVEDNIAVCYFAVVLACLGLYPLNPTTSSWTLNNLAGPTKRAMGIAYMISMGNSGGVVGSYIFKSNEAPRYPTGFGTGFGFAAAGLVAALILEFVYDRINKRRAALTEDEVRAQYTQEQLDEMGDRSPLFRYAL